MAVSTWPLTAPTRQTTSEPERATPSPGPSATEAASTGATSGEATSGEAPRTPILVDAKGYRRRLVRTVTFLAMLAFGGLLLAVPVSLLAPEHVTQAAVADAATASALRGTVFVDQDCDVHRTAGEPLVGALRVELIRAGVGTIATTRTDATGAFAFERIAADVDYHILVSTGVADATTALYTHMPDPAAGSIDFALPGSGSCASAR
jgi:hypothetical protein